MTTKDKKITAQQARDIQQSGLLSRARKVHSAKKVVNLAAPIVPKAIQPDNLLPFEQVENGMDVEFPQWTYNIDDELQVFWNDSVTPIITQAFPAMPTFPVKLTVAPGVLGSGSTTNILSYKVVRNSGADNDSDALLVKIDTRAPGHGQQLPAPILDSREVTPEYLAANGNVLKAKIPAWDAAFEAGVVITPYYIEYALPKVTVTADDVQAGEVAFNIPGEVITTLGEGARVAYYTATSRAGYDSERSRTAPVMVYLTEAPSDLQAPLIPLNDDGLIDLDDVNAGVIANIPAFLHFQPTDTITVHWGSQALTPVPVGNGDFPVPVAVLRQLIAAEGNGPIDVMYAVTRAGRSWNSPVTRVEVDISSVGPVDPDPTTPENEALLPPTVVGGAGGADNVLTPADKGKDASATIPFYSENVAVDQVITLYWGKAPETSKYVGEHVVTADDIDAEAFPAIVVPAAIVDATGNNASLQVYYTVQASATAEPANAALSMAQTVKVRLAGPGGPGGLGAADFPDKNSRGWLLLEAVEEGARVTVPVYEEMKLGDSIAINWLAYADTNNATPIAGTEYTSPAVTVTHVELVNGAKFVVPYSTAIFPILANSLSGQGSGKVVYTVEQGGDLFTSAEAPVKIDLKKPQS